MTERFDGVGLKNRRVMKKLWKAQRSRLSLKRWARTAQLGEIAHVWVRAKNGGKDDASTNRE